jgi:hypothetical protein
LAALCKIKIQPALGLAFDGQNLAPFIITAGRANGVAADGAAALRALGQLRAMPAIGRFALSQSHLRSFSFWNSHGERVRKAEFAEITTALSLF